MSRIKKKLKKRIAIIGIPVVTVCVATYLSFTLFSHGSKSTFAYEHYYENNNKNEGNETSNVEDGTVVDIDDDSDSTEEVVEVITSHDSVVLDTNPESITVIVNKELSLPTDYIPGDLVVPNVTFSIPYYDEKKLIREEAARALEKLFLAASQKGLNFNAVSGYRSYDRQYDIFTNNIKTQGLKHTLAYSAIPGYSEHQTGLSMDVSTKSVNNRLDATFAGTPEGMWLKDNAHLYGYIIRYPEDKTDITGYSYEPWHIRYVGKALALYLYNNNLSLEEYYNFEPKLDSYYNITMDQLVQNYGIALADMIRPTIIPTLTPTVTPSVTPTEILEEEETGEETDDGTKEDDLEGDEPTDPSEEGTNGDPGIDPTTSPDGETDEDTPGEITPTKVPGNQGTGTPTPTKAPSNHGTGTPTPTITPTPTPNNQGTGTPTPSTAPTQIITG